MAVVSYNIEQGPVQVDGRLSLVERYQRDDATEAMFCSFVPEGTDLDALAAERISRIDEQDARTEIQTNVAEVTERGSLAAVIVNFTTLDANRAAIRNAYLTAKQIAAVMLGDYLATLTNHQLQTLFGMTSMQVNVLRAQKLQPAAHAATLIRASLGA